MKLYVQGCTRLKHVERVPDMAMMLKLYLRGKKTAATLTIRLDYVNEPVDQTNMYLRGNIFPLV
jgi:hypothetical protein